MILPQPTPAIYSPAPTRVTVLDTTTYAVQITDSLVTSNAIKQCGGRENFAPLRPFAHGGAATYLLGFAAFDYALHTFFRHAPHIVHDVEVAQIAASAKGLRMDAQRWCK